MKKKFRFLIILAISILFIFQLLIQLRLAKEDSLIIDESLHLSAGYIYLTRGDFRFNPEHPPLLKYLAALPFLFLKPNEPSPAPELEQAKNFNLDSYDQNLKWGHRFLYSSNNDADKLIFYARLGPIFLTLLLGITIVLIAIKFWGYWAGLIAGALYVFDPLIAGHGHLITTDIAAAFGYLISLSSFWFFLKKPKLKTIILFGLALGVAQLMKFTLLALLPFVMIIFLFYFFQRRKKLLFLSQFLFSFLIALLVIWAGYGFHRHTLPFDSINETMKYLPLPLDYLKGASMVLNHTKSGHTAFLLGQISRFGWWYYFPVLVIFKTPIVSLVLYLASIILIIINRKKFKETPIFIFAFAALWFFLVAIYSRSDLGLRHIMPIYPLLILITAAAFTILVKKWQIIWSILIIILGIHFIFSYPYYLSYFNRLASGSYNGRKIATDSNLDWSQDIKRIKKYLEQNKNLHNPYLAYYWDGETALDYYQIKRRPLDELKMDRSGDIIIGASLLQLPDWQWLKSYQLIDHPLPGVLVYNLNTRP